MLGLSPLEIGIVALVVVLLFGTRKLPELGSGLGKAISNFRKGYQEGMAIDVTPPKEESAREEKSSSSDEKDR
ncbi:twin-arginine translocase TatA/TatE family subunit [bacterium]|nr:twin-arginine translocase TatA/TatE family subunit [bacterium]